VSNLVKIAEVILIDEIPVLGTGKTDYKILKTMISFDKQTHDYNFDNVKETFISKLAEISCMKESDISEKSIF
jgi:hypothetical protein